MYKSNGINRLGLSYGSTIDLRGLVSKTVHDDEGESSNRGKIEEPLSTGSGYTLPLPPASDHTEMGDDLISGLFASPTITYHHADDQENIPTTDLEYATRPESSESQGNSSRYEGQYSGHNSEEEMPGGFNDEDHALAWWYVHQRPYYMNQICRADLEARQMRSNARTVDQMRRLLRNIVIHEETTYTS